MGLKCCVFLGSIFHFICIWENDRVTATQNLAQMSLYVLCQQKPTVLFPVIHGIVLYF